MDEKNLKEKIDIAKAAVSGEDEPYKTEAFKIIFSNLLNTKTKPSRKITTKIRKSNQKVSQNRKIKFDKKHDLEEFSSKCKITQEELKDTITIKNDIIEILKRINAQENFKHIAFTLIILTGYRIIYEIEWLPASLLKKCLDHSGVGDLLHLPRSLSKTSLIVNSGEKRGTEYKVTGKGMDSAYEYIKKLAKGENIIEK